MNNFPPRKKPPAPSQRRLAAMAQPRKLMFLGKVQQLVHGLLPHGRRGLMRLGALRAVFAVLQL